MVSNKLFLNYCFYCFYCFYCMYINIIHLSIGYWFKSFFIYDSIYAINWSRAYSNHNASYVHEEKCVIKNEKKKEIYLTKKCTWKKNGSHTHLSLSLNFINSHFFCICGNQLPKSVRYLIMISINYCVYCFIHKNMPFFLQKAKLFQIIPW